MENLQQSKRQITTSSGLSELPNLLSYPKILTLDDTPEIGGQLVYVIENYPDEGLGIMIKRSEGIVQLVIGDWNGNIIDFEKRNHKLFKAAYEFTHDYSSQFIEMMRLLNIDQMMVYISVDADKEEMLLVDLRTSLNKFYGPGMVRDLFSKIFPTQNVIKIVRLEQDVLDTIKNNQGSYQGDLILKCSAFKTIVRDKDLLPLYARVLR